MITRLAHVCIASTDLLATERFYCGCLGFKKAFDFIQGGQVIGFYLQVPGGTYIEVFQQGAIDPEAHSPIRHLCFETSDVAAVGQRLAMRGYRATEKKLGGDKSWQIWTSDPSGVAIEFHEYTPESSQNTGKSCILD